MPNAKKGKKSKAVKKTAKAKRPLVAKRKMKPKTAKSRKSAKTPRMEKPIGKVTHFYGHISVAIVRFNQKFSSGIGLHFKGATTDFTETVKSMQYNHASIAVAPKGKQIGIKVKKKVREGDLVYKAE
jgi:putative protease